MSKKTGREIDIPEDEQDGEVKHGKSLVAARPDECFAVVLGKNPAAHPLYPGHGCRIRQDT